MDSHALEKLHQAVHSTTHRRYSVTTVQVVNTNSHSLYKAGQRRSTTN